MIDTHAHLWDTGVLDYPWLAEADTLPKVFLPADLREGDREKTRFVFVQADCLASQGLEEARWVADRGADDLAGIVAFAPLETAAVTADLAALDAVPGVVGIRRLLQDADEELLDSPDLDAGLEAVSARGWTFDACIHWQQLSALTRLAARHEGLPIVLDHLGKPPLDSDDTQTFALWRSQLADLASLPHVFLKLSGLPAETVSEPTAGALGPWLRAAFDLFGPDRSMLGSDYPVSRRRGMVRADWFDLVASALGASAAEWAQVREHTARAVYRLDLD
ncbi:amidohydrolase family protein [Microbacterium koreense]|uniref:amidohydrolase family protein n=1 Tax=Microbacterium koreense TaxID=323761 RepID=UPI0036243D07